MSERIMNGEYKISDVMKNEYRDFAIYTVENRAIPSVMDGLKNVQRFYLYSSIKNSRNDFKKVSAIGGIVSDYGYNHGEMSAAQAGQLMAADWSNHVCIIQGRGNFGSRLVPEAAASRYTYSKISEDFFKLFPDIDLCPKHSDIEHEPPAFYLPILPMVLINGVRGIATGFAVNILPRDPKSIHKAVESVIAGKKLKPNSIKPSFPKCQNTFEFDTVKKSWLESVPFEWPTATKLVIKDVLYDTSREDYIKVLDGLEENDLIVGYEDCCSETFGFEVSLKRGVKYTEAQLIKMFKLQRYHTENINVIDDQGRLNPNYTCVEEIITDFIEKRTEFLAKRIEKNKRITAEKERYSNVIIEYIEAVLTGKVVFSKGKKSDVVKKEILKNTSATEEDCEKLLRMSMFSLTDEKVKELKEELKGIKQEVKYWKETTEKAQYEEDLDSIRKLF